MRKNVQSTPFAKLQMILQKLDNFHEPFGHNKSGGLWVSATVHVLRGATYICCEIQWIRDEWGCDWEDADTELHGIIHLRGVDSQPKHRSRHLAKT